MNLAAKMSLDTASFTGPLRGVLGGMRSVLGLAAAAGGVVGVVAGLRSGIKMGSELSDLKDRTGAAVGELVLLRQAFEDTGVGAAGVPTAIQYMQKALSGLSEEGKPTIQTFRRLGLDMKALKELSPTEQLVKIGAAINGLESDADKTEAALTIFGRSGAALKQFFADPAAIQKARDGLGSLPEVLQRDAAMLDNLDDALGRLKGQTSGLFVGLASELAPALSGVLDDLKGIDLTHVGQQAGRVVAILGEAFASGKLGDLVGQSLSVGIRSAVSMLAESGLWKGLANVIEGEFLGLESFLMTAFTRPIAHMRAGIRKAMDEVKEVADAPKPTEGQMLLQGLFPKLNAVRAALRFGSGEQPTKAMPYDYYLRNALRENEQSAEDMGPTGENLIKLGRSQISAAKLNVGAEMGPEREKLRSLLDGLNAEVDANMAKLRAAAAPAPAAGPVSPAAALSGGKGAGAPDVDRWAKVGLFVGGGGGPALDYNRRTATATEKLTAWAEKTHSALMKWQPGGAAAWANA